jgi:hypothetical protein
LQADKLNAFCEHFSQLQRRESDDDAQDDVQAGE